MRRPDLFGFLDGIATTSPVSANRIQACLRTMLGFAVENDLIGENLLAGAKRRGGTERSKDRVLSDAEVKALWEALETSVGPSIKLALRTILLTCARPGEVAAMRRDELDLDAKDGALWTIPGDRTKNGRLHVVPLSATAVACIREAMAHSDKIGGGVYVFCSRYEAAESIARHSMSQAVKRIIAAMNEAKPDSAKPFSPHDLRRTGATLARAEGAERDAVSALLNHTRSDVTGVYDRYDMLKEKREVVELLAKRVARIIG